MAGKINVYNLGTLGVDLVKSPLHIPDGAWTSAQNAEFPNDGGEGGLKKRGGLSRINSSALAGAVQAMLNAPFPLFTESDLMVALNTGDATNSWKKSILGASYVDLPATTLGYAASLAKSPSGIGVAAISAGQRSATFRRQFYFAGNDYILYPTASHSAPPVVVWDGVLSLVVFRIPTNPTATAASHAMWISDFYQADEVIYIAVQDAGGVAPDHKGRVLAFDPSNGTLSLVGNRFGQGSGENPAGFPFCLTKHLGQLWVGTYGISGNNRGKIYRIQPGIDETWTLDLYATLHNGYYMSLCSYQGQLYAATDADSSGTAIVQVRDSAGAWTTSLSAPASNVGYFTSLIEFNSDLYCCWYQSGVATLVKKLASGSWSTDKDIGADIGQSRAPGTPFIYRSELYWPFMSESATGATGFLMKRTTGGVWSTVLSSQKLRGCLGKYTPDV